MSEKRIGSMSAFTFGGLKFAGLTCILLAQSGCSGMSLFDNKEKPAPAAYSKQKEVLTEEERPATPKTMYAYARILAAQGKDQACDGLLSKVIATSPRVRDAYILQAEVRMRMHRVADAISTLKAAQRVFPRDDVILNNLGMCLMMKSDCPAALACFTHAAASRPVNGRYRANMAMALGLLGREEESSSLYNMVVSSTDSAHNIAVLNSARAQRLGSHITPVDPRPAAPVRKQDVRIENTPAPVSIVEPEDSQVNPSLITDAGESTITMDNPPEYQVIQP